MEILILLPGSVIKRRREHSLAHTRIPHMWKNPRPPSWVANIDFPQSFGERGVKASCENPLSGEIQWELPNILENVLPLCPPFKINVWLTPRKWLIIWGKFSFDKAGWAWDWGEFVLEINVWDCLVHWVWSYGVVLIWGNAQVYAPLGTYYVFAFRKWGWNVELHMYRTSCY